MFLVPNTLGTKTLSLLILAGMFSFISCRQNTSETSLNGIHSSPSPSGPSAQKEVSRKAWEDIFFSDINQQSLEAGLGKLREVEVPSDSLEIRIWAGFDMASLRGLQLRRTREQSSAMFVRANKSSQNSTKAPIVLPPPKSGWDSLWKQLNHEDILTLPDAVDVGADNVYPDARGIVVEIKSSDAYRAYNYNGFETSEHAEAKKVAMICKVVSKEFKVFLC